MTSLSVRVDQEFRRFAQRIGHIGRKALQAMATKPTLKTFVQSYSAARPSRSNIRVSFFLRKSPMPQEPPALHPMLSLATAAGLAYKAAMNREAGEQTLNTVARMIASRFTIFASEDRESHTNPARVMPDEVFEGDFEGGGATLNFNDGRPRLTNLCMRRVDLDKAIAEIRALYDRPAS